MWFNEGWEEKDVRNGTALLKILNKKLGND